MKLDMIYHVSFLAAHLVAIGLLVSLWSGAPDRLQKWVLGLLIGSIVVYAVIDILKLLDIDIAGALWRAASLPMQYAVLIAIFRLWQLKREGQCKRSQQGSPRLFP